MRIRFAVREDQEMLVCAGEEMYRHGRFGHLRYDAAKVARLIQHAIDNPAYFPGLAETTEGELAGFLLGNMEYYFFAPEPIAQAAAFFVRPPYRGSSAAPKLLGAFRQWAAKRDAREVVVGTGVSEGQDLAKTDRFLRKMGLTPTGTNYVQRLR